MIRLLAMFTLLSLFANTGSGATATWTGGGADINWMTPANWSQGVIPSPGDDLVFPSLSATVTHIAQDNFPNNTRFHSITTQGFWALEGNSVVITNAMTMGSGYVGGVTILMTVMLGGNVTLTDTCAPPDVRYTTSSVTFTRALYLGPYTLTTAGTGTIGFNAALIGTGSLISAGYQTILIVPSAFSGGATVSAGTLSLFASNALGTGAVSIAGTGQLVLSTLTGSGGPVSLANDITISTRTEPAITCFYQAACSGTIRLMSDSTLSGGSRQPLALSGTITGPASLSLSEGEFFISGDNSYAGSTDIQAYATCVLESPTGLGQGTLPATVETLGTLNVRASPLISRIIINGSGVQGSGALETDAGLSLRCPVAVNSDATIRVDNAGFSVSSLSLMEVTGSGTLSFIGDGFASMDPRGYVGAIDVALPNLEIPEWSYTASSTITIESGSTVSITAAPYHGPELGASLIMLPASTLTAFGDVAVPTLDGSGVVLLDQSTITIGVGDASSTFMGSFSSADPFPTNNPRVFKTGQGNLTLGGVNAFAGEIALNQGTLAITGDSSAVPLLMSGGTLTGTGKVGSLTATAGVISPGGAQFGVLSCLSLTLSPAVSVVMDVQGNLPGYSQDQLVTYGNIALAGAQLQLSSVPRAGGEILIKNTMGNVISGIFTSALPIVYNAGPEHDVALSTALPEPLILVVDAHMTYSGSSPADQFVLPLRPGLAYNASVDWGDGQRQAITTSTSPGHTYSDHAPHQITISENVPGGFPAIYFNHLGDARKVLQVSNWGTNTWKSMNGAFAGCSNLLLTAADAASAHMDTVTDFQHAWDGCTALTTFPQLNTRSGTNFSYAWYGCSGLASFPAISTGNAVYCLASWEGCSGLTAFPVLDTGKVRDFSNAWTSCTALTSFPLLNTHLGVYFNGSWQGCSGLSTFPQLDTGSGQRFNLTWSACSGLTSFPLLTMANGLQFYRTWSECTKLTDFPAVNMGQATDVDAAWYHCLGLSAFPALDLHSMVSGVYSFTDDTLAPPSYSALLIRLAAANTHTNVTLYAGNSYYDASAIPARATLLGSRGWTILDKGLLPTPVPVNDAFASAISLNPLTSPLAATSAGASREPGEPLHAGNAGGKSVWFSFTAPGKGSLAVDTMGSSFDTLLAVYQRQPGTLAVGSLIAVGSNDDIDSKHLQSAVTVAVVAGVTYYIAVDGYAGASGPILLNWHYVPAAGG